MRTWWTSCHFTTVLHVPCFLSFDLSIQRSQLDDDSGGGLEDTEGDYDALNSETFGGAINGDWENIHENLVRLDGQRPSTSTNAAAAGPNGGTPAATAAVAARAAAQRNRRADLKDDHGESDLGEFVSVFRGRRQNVAGC